MSWLYSRALVEEYSEDISLDGEPCALLNGKPTQLPFWCSDKTMARCQLSQSGMTFKPLTASHGEDVLTSFLEAFPAKTSVVQEKERASKESDLPCGRTWRESLEKFDLDTHTWKTHQCLWDEDLPPSSVILPKWGMMRSGVLWERTTLPRLTSETESGSWPTPTCQEVEHPDAELTDTGRRLSKDGKSSHSLNLADSVKKWPTPCANEDAAGTPNGNMQKKLGNDPKVRGETPEEWSKGALSPDWVEWLMGWPIGWTSMEAITELDWRDWKTDPADDCDPDNFMTPRCVEIDESHEKFLARMKKSDNPKNNTKTGFGNLTMQVKSMRNMRTNGIPRVATGIKNRVGRLKAIGNGQVPQVAALAWNILNEK